MARPDRYCDEFRTSHHLHCHERRTFHSIRYGDWKLIVAGKGKAQLFNIGSDPYEKSDLAGSMPDIVTDLRSRLAAHQAKDQPEMPQDLVGLPG